MKNYDKNEDSCSFNFKGSIMIYKDSNNLKRYFFVQLNDTICMELLKNYSNSNNRDSAIDKIYTFYKNREIKTLQQLDFHTIKYYEYFLDSNNAPNQIIRKIKSNEDLIVDSSSFKRSNTIWYSLNGYLPDRCCDEDPPTFYINKRKCLGINSYIFSIE